ncbi:diguanylate cyclase, partial [Escherichia coli ECA-0157]
MRIAENDKMHSQGTFICRRCQRTCYLGSVSIDSLDFWPLLADWFSEQFSTGVLIVPCMLTLAIPGVLPRFKAEQMM